MKKIFIIIMLAVFLTSCYDEFRNDYPYTTVAFSTVTGGLENAGELGRTVVKDEGLRLDIGVYLAGVIENKEERWVKYSIDPALLTGTPYTLMPANYYTLSNSNTFTIPSGNFIGRVTVTLDSVRFLSDPDAVNYTYAIPIRLTETSADSILSSQNTKIVVIKYINHYDGYYDNTGTFTTYDEGGAEINTGSVTSAYSAQTLELDSVITNGVNYLIGENYLMKMVVRPDKSVWFKKLPTPPQVAKNLAPQASLVSTSYVSGWEKLEAVRDGHEPTSSTDKVGGAYGNWWSTDTWRWIQYDFPRLSRITRSDVYWWTDGGGIQPPDDTYVEYWDESTQAWLAVPNPVGNGGVLNQWNITTFDEVITTKIRVWMISYIESCGILEWKVMGIPVPVTPEQAIIDEVVPDGANTFDPATSTFTFNYKVTYENETYYTKVSAKAVWRNRIRDKVNEWRR
ncbi:MAG TPA: DUF1735 domain-containing protein [Bacteroidales bacterium]|nr:DUF1735 domain-containing protein [Bacteroidales bacterium]